jgi:hypothetical protein
MRHGPLKALLVYVSIQTLKHREEIGSIDGTNHRRRVFRSTATTFQEAAGALAYRRGVHHHVDRFIDSAIARGGDHLEKGQCPSC